MCISDRLYDAVCVAEATEFSREVEFGFVVVGRAVHPFIEDSAEDELICSQSLVFGQFQVVGLVQEVVFEGPVDV